MGSSVQEYRIKRMQEEEHNNSILYRRVASALYIFRCIRQSGIYQIKASSQLFQLIRNSLQIFSFILALVCFSIIARLVVRFSTALVCFSTILVCLSTVLALCACTSIAGAVLLEPTHTFLCAYCFAVTLLLYTSIIR